MATYTPPLRDMHFVLHELLDVTSELKALPVHADIDADTIDESLFDAHVSLADLPPLDLFIRTGGEHRVSNFLLWQLAYAELWFSDVLWPDFDAAALDAALDDYARRERRYGRTGQQLRHPA